MMTGLPTGTYVMAEAAGRTLARKLDTAVLVKGGHLGGDEAVDLLIHAGSPDRGIELRSPRIKGGEDVHGTGCALSSSIATYLAQGRELDEAVQLGKQYVTRLIENPVNPGRGASAVR